jgi:hypothetical protein
MRWLGAAAVMAALAVSEFRLGCRILAGPSIKDSIGYMNTGG